ncbi:MAG: hypothetical protein ACI9V1_000020 [Spirosomataceae bacterium]|jgi:hypothetical protein
MKKVLLPTIVLLTSILSSCSQEENTTFEKQYIDLQVIIEKTIRSNEAINPTYLKEVWINDDQETITAENLDWAKELEVFYLVDLNKRDYLNKYEKDSTDSGLIYSLRPENEAPVKKLTVRFDSTRSVSEIEATLTTDNFLYGSERELHLQFLNAQLTKYEINGWQELFIGSKKTYRMKATKKGD